MADWNEDDDDEDVGYETILEGAEQTGLEAKFVKLPALNIAPDELAAMTVIDMIATYKALRDQLATDRKGYKAREIQIKVMLSNIGLLLYDKGKQLGVDSFATEAGTAYKHKSTKYRLPGWDEFWNYVRTTNNPQLLQKRISPTAAAEIIREEGSIPGVEVYTEETFSVRSPTARKKS